MPRHTLICTIGTHNARKRKESTMTTMPRHTLICTIGTSLFYPNLSKLAQTNPTNPLGKAYAGQKWKNVASQLHLLEPTDRQCGAEINSVADLLRREYIDKVHLHLLYSDTSDGEHIAAVLDAYFADDGWQVQTHRVCDLSDQDPRAFRTRGLRNLAKILGQLVRDAGPDYCAINATGGYKAQIAIAVLMGQALGIPVYYKHERFDEIIPFPPMPVALDFSLWLRASGMFTALSQPNACVPEAQFSEDWDERFEPLVERVSIDGVNYLELSATGQIFHDTFRSRFQQQQAGSLPPESSKKEDPELGAHSYKNAHETISRFLQKITDERPYVRSCHSTYWNPDLPEANRFRLSGGQVQGIYSNRTWCVKFTVLTTASEQDDLGVVVADLNEWLSDQ